MKLRTLVGLAVASVSVLVAGVTAADGPSCELARKELAKARVRYAKATRRHDVAANAYLACRETKNHCKAHKARLTKAIEVKRTAAAELNFATAKVGQACG